MYIPEFTDLTYKFIKDTSVSWRKAHGQYFTPRPIREHLLAQLPLNIKSPRILDPGCGTGEFLLSATAHFKSPILEGWDIDEKVLEVARQIVPKASLTKTNALFAQEKEIYDFVIGNPPYFEFSPDKEIRERYADVIKGRVNIFSLFVKQGLDLLKPGGYLAYVIPPSMNNGAYFAALRDYIIKNANIEYLKIIQDTDLFIDALQMTMVLVLRKGENTGQYIFEHSGVKIFSEKYKYLRRQFQGCPSLKDLGYSVRTGRVVWNQNREKLTTDANDSIPLIWAHNITPNGLELPSRKPGVHDKKPQYIKNIVPDSGPAIVVNRITGASKNARIKAAIIPAGVKFVAENHCNVIFPPRKKNQNDLFTRSIGQLSIGDLLVQIQSRDKLEVMQNITGNTQISKTELEKLFPVTVFS